MALNRALIGFEVASASAEALVADTVFASIRVARSTLFRLACLRHRAALDRARWGSKVARRFYYTYPGWVMSDVAVEDGFGFDVSRCVVAEFFQSYGMGDLCNRVICQQDIRSARRHGVILHRTETLAAGGSRCDFRYEKAPDRLDDALGSSAEGTDAGSDGLASARPLVDSVEIEAPPIAVWAWLATMADHYADWHPDHISATWIRGSPGETGSRLEAIEYLAGRRERLVLELTHIDPPRLMSYRILGPHSILLPGGRFVISECDDHSIFRAEIDVRFPRVGAIVFGQRTRALRAHMHEEGRSIKRLIETSHRSFD